MPIGTGSAEALVRRGRQLEAFTIGYNLFEGAVSLVAGVLAGSVALIGFGLDSLIEVASGAAVLWRLSAEGDACRRERSERTALRVVGGLLLALAVYVAWESAGDLWRHEAPGRSALGIAMASLSVVVMPLLARAKRRVALAMSSGAMHADSRQADFCAYLAAILLGGLVLNAWLGWWWADPVAALAMTPVIAKEGVDGLRGRACCGCES